MYKYNKKKFYIKSVSAYIAVMLLCTVIPFIATSDYSLVIKIFVGGSTVFWLWAIKLSDKHTDSYVEFKEDFVILNSFYISSEADNYTVSYSDIEEIYASESIFGKITDVYIKTTEYDESFEINSNYEIHIKLYDELCKVVKTKNPAVKIDERIYDLINKKSK